MACGTSDRTRSSKNRASPGRDGRRRRHRFPRENRHSNAEGSYAFQQLIRIICFSRNVFSALLFAAFIPVAPVSSITTGATIATCFAPEENCNAVATDAMNGAEREILVSTYSLTTGSGIPEALARAAQRGVDVRVMADRTTPCDRNAGADLIVRAGASVWIDRGVRIAHAKTMVIDGKVTLVGSMNWSRGAALNSENLNLVVSPEVAETYAAHWRQRLSASVPFTSRDEWCRRRAAGGGL
jgi:phosphatidylserine/phosphatidylglycerophosphate/cardiolipin synthase-like enzyme